MIEITESEYVKLIKLSSRDRCVEGSFGAGRVSLDETPENAVLHHQRVDAGVTQQHTDPRLGVPGALFDGGVGEPHRFEGGELVVAGGDFFGGHTRCISHGCHRR